MTADQGSGFTCEVCGEQHSALTTDIACKLPDAVFELDYLEQYARSKSNSDLCTLDGNRWFIRCVLPVPFTHTEGFFGWGIWVEVAQAHHDAYIAHFYEGAALVAPFEGQLANHLRAFNRVRGLAVRVELSDEHRPFAYLSSTSRHPLALEQRRGIDAARHHALVIPHQSRR